MISIVCPVFNEEAYISTCVDSILAQDYPMGDIEVLFVDGMSTDKTRLILSYYMKDHPFIYILDNPLRVVPVAMNIGIKASKGNVIIRLDAHATYPPNYFSVLVNRLIELNADNVGAVCQTDVLHKNGKTLAIKEVLSNKFGVGNSIFRLGTDDVIDVDTVPFGCWRREVFDKYGCFNNRLIRNQDIELNKRILRGGGRVCLVPDTYCIYLARETLKGIAKNNFANGKWNILTIYYTKQLDSLSIRHFIPLFFILSLLVPALLFVFYLPFFYVSLLSLFLYLIVLGKVCFTLSLKKSLNFFYLFATFSVLHISYGWGSLVGILQVLFKK